MSALQRSEAKTEGHLFSDNTISGGAVHFGDTYYVSGSHSTENRFSVWQDPLKKERHEGAVSQQPRNLYLVPRCSTAQFTGRRSQLQQLQQFFAPSTVVNNKERHKIVVLVGLGGSGKTQVCLRYAEVSKDLYWGVFWIDASSRSNAEAAYAYLGQQAGSGPTWTAGKYWLSQCSRPWLLVLDNADDLQMDITDFIPAGNSGHVLVTTRLHDMCIHATVGHIDFGRMEPEEAVELLLKSAYADAYVNSFNTQQRSIANGIASALGYLAIALNQAGATIRRKIYTIEEYLHCYLGDRHRLLNRRRISFEEVNVITTWEIPFRRIEQQSFQEYQDAVVLMCVFAFLHFDAISEALFHNMWSHQKRQSDHLDSLPDLFTSGSKTRLHSAISVLSEYSILDVDSTSGICSLHPVVHQWAKSRMDTDDKMVQWLRCTLYLLSCYNPDNLDAASGLQILPHIDYCFEIIKEHAPAMLQTKSGIDWVERLSRVYEASGAWLKALQILEIVLKYRQQSQGRRHEDTLTTQRSISRCFWNLFQVEPALKMQLQILMARWYHRPALTDWMHFWKPDHLSYCIALDDLTQTLWLAGLREKSRMVGERAVNGLSKRLGREDPRTWNAMFNLGRTYRHTGQLDAAHQLLSYVLHKRRKTLGWNHLDTLMVRNELGMSFWARDKHLAVAQRLVSSVRDARSRILGRDHAYTLWSANDLSKILCARGRYLEAVQLLEEIVPLVEQTLGRDHVGIHMTKGNLARSYALNKSWAKAETVLLEILGFINEQHPDWFHYMYGYVRIESELGHFEVAEATCQKMLKRAATEGKTSLHFKSATELLGNIYFLSERTEELSFLKKTHPWISEDNVRNPPSPVALSHMI